MNRSIVALFSELFFSASCIVIIHFLFGHGKLLPNVVMFPEYTDPIDVWELLWLVVLTDLIVKIITVDIKILVTMMPAIILPFHKRVIIVIFIFMKHGSNMDLDYQIKIINLTKILIWMVCHPLTVYIYSYNNYTPPYYFIYLV